AWKSPFSSIHLFKDDWIGFTYTLPLMPFYFLEVWRFNNDSNSCKSFSGKCCCLSLFSSFVCFDSVFRFLNQSVITSLDSVCFVFFSLFLFAFFLFFCF